MKLFVLSALMVLAAACSSNNNAGPDATTVTDSGNNNKDSGSSGTDSGTPDSGSAVDSGSTVDSGPSVPTFYGGPDGGFVSTTPVLLVDNDDSDNNKLVMNPTPSTSDVLYGNVAQGLQSTVGLSYTLWVVPGDGTGSNRPTQTDLAGINIVLWYTGANDKAGGNGTMTPAQETALSNWLNEGGKALAIFSENLVSDLAPAGNWTVAPTDNMLANYIGAAGTVANPDFFVGTVADGGADELLSDLTGFNVVGALTLTGQSYNVLVASCSPPLINTSLSAINPSTSMISGAGIDVLAKTQADPADTATGNVATPVAVGHKMFTTDGGTPSTIVFVGFPIEDVNPVAPDGGTVSVRNLFTGLGAYLGL
jgi:hypothetical protein